MLQSCDLCHLETLFPYWDENPVPTNPEVNTVLPEKEDWMKEESVLFKDTLNTFIYGYMAADHLVKDHSDSEGKPAAATWATLSD